MQTAEHLITSVMEWNHCTASVIKVKINEIKMKNAHMKLASVNVKYGNLLRINIIITIIQWIVIKYTQILYYS